MSMCDCEGFGIRRGQQSDKSDQLCGDLAAQLLGSNWRHVPHAQLAGRREADTF